MGCLKSGDDGLDNVDVRLSLPNCVSNPLVVFSMYNLSSSASVMSTEARRSLSGSRLGVDS